MLITIQFYAIFDLVGGIILKNKSRLMRTSGLPPHDSSDAVSNPAEVVEFLRTKKFREQVLREGLSAV
jgi:hypothetical protein